MEYCHVSVKHRHVAVIRQGTYVPEETQILQLLGQKKPRPGGLVDLTRKGVAYATARKVLERFELDTHQATAILGTSERTLARRIQRKQPLDPVETDRLVRFLRLAAHAEEVFEDRERATHWLKTKNRALGGKVPMELLDTDAGTEQVDEILTRIDYAVYS